MATVVEEQTVVPDKVATRAWIAYDFINSLVIINGSLYFSRWITIDQRIGSFWYGLTYSVSTIALLLVAPVVGAAIDRRKNGRSVLLYTSILIGTFAIAITGLGHNDSTISRIGGTLIAFGAINFCYQLSLVPYNWLLPHIRGVHSSAQVTRYTGFGECAGSMGSVVGAVVGSLLLTHVLGETADGRLNLLAVMGTAYLALFAADYIVMGRGIDRVVLNGQVSDRSFASVLSEYFRDNIAVVRRSPKLVRYLIAFMLYADALLTVNLFLPVYLRERVGLTDSETAKVFVIALAVAAITAWIFGRLAPRALRRIIVVALLLWLGVFGALAYVSAQTILMWLTIVIAGILFGVLWSASRAFLYQLSERETLGRGYGLYSTFERCASILGPLVWGGVMAINVSVGQRYATAFASMGLFVLVGILILIRSRHDDAERA